LDIYRQRSEFGSGDAFGDMWTRPDPEPAELRDIYSYALTVDGDAYARAVYRRELPSLIEELDDRWQRREDKALTFVELRLLLFLWERFSHRRESPESGAELAVLRDLYQAVREAWEREWPRAQAPTVRGPGPPLTPRPRPGFRACPYCHKKSDNAVDIRHRYCPWCREFYDRAGLQLHEDRFRHPEGEWWATLGSYSLYEAEQRVAQIEALREGGAEGPGEGAVNQGGDEMTQTYEREDQCAVCGGRSTHDYLMSFSGGGGSDLDGRPQGRPRSVIQWLVHRCPYCGYCSPDISEAPCRAGYVVASESYRQQLDDPSMPYLAQSLLCSAMIVEVAHSSSDNKVIERRLEAAWVCDDAGYEAAASACRLAAAAAVEGLNRMGGQYHENDMRADHALLADLYRRAGHFEEADANVQWGLGIIPGNPLGWTRCLELQQALIEAGDAGVHTIKEESERPTAASGVVDDVYRGTPTYVQVLCTLVETARSEGTAAAADIAPVMGVWHGGQAMGTKVGQALNEISEDEVRLGRPMLSAVVVGRSGRPGAGFFALARTLGRLSVAGDEKEFWQAELSDVYRVWRLPEEL